MCIKRSTAGVESVFISLSSNLAFYFFINRLDGQSSGPVAFIRLIPNCVYGNAKAKSFNWCGRLSRGFFAVVIGGTGRPACDCVHSTYLNALGIQLIGALVRALFLLLFFCCCLNKFNSFERCWCQGLWKWNQLFLFFSLLLPLRSLLFITIFTTIFKIVFKWSN